jgi:hypothetical protein
MRHPLIVGDPDMDTALDRLLTIMARLRDRERACIWDGV